MTDYYYNGAYSSDCDSPGPPGNTNGYLTEIKGAKGFTQTFTYRYCDGQLNSATDRNNQTTSYSYVDSLARLTEIVDPDTGTITNTYNDGSPTSSIVTSRTMDSSGTTNVTTQILDGAGHVTQSQLNSDPDCSGADNTNTAYDGLGRVWKVSNPYCSTAPDPHSTGTTKYTYDALGRVTSVAAPDNSATNTTYSGNSTTVTDPQLHARTSLTDALGRMYQVREDPGSLNYLTSYTYDGLDNLLTVKQGAQTRSFAYDSLSRLTSATNPESGTTTYTYSTPSSVCSGDPSSPCTRTDARGITTYYNKAWNGNSCPYDALNRLVCKSYSDGTPAAQFFYDESSATLGSWTRGSLAHPNGRLTHTTTVNSSGAVLTATVQDYDQMGRTTNYWQCTPNCGANSIWSSNYQHKYTGEVYQWTHPAGYSITNTISGARRITAMQSSWTDSTHPQYLAQSINYTPWGAVSKFVNGYAGSGANAQETYTYNNRLQPAVIELGTTGNPTADYCMVYDYYGSQPASCGLPSQGTNNNGNVMGYWYQDSVNTSSFPHKASYTYDGANRLATATAKTLSGNTIWSQTYGSQSYSHPDQWGNWTCSGTGVCPSLTWNSQNNQLLTIGNYSFSYDTAGNMTQDPSNYPAQPVHTYQWDAEGRVASVDRGSTWSFTYNALGHRVQWASPSGGELHLFDPEGNWLGNANSYTLVRFGERPLALYEGSQTYFNHVSALGSTSMFTNQTGGPQEDMLFYPWGDVWKSWGTGGYNFAYLPYRDLSTTTDITTARFISPNFGRWFSPDPLGGHLEDPQTLNKYAYVRNNPTSLTDPTGLDFYLTCTSTKENAQSCQQYQNGSQTPWVQGVTTNDENGNMVFTPPVVKSDEQGNLVDQYGASYTGTYTGQTVSFQQQGSTQSVAGVWKQNSDPTSGINGAGAYQGFNFTFSQPDQANRLHANWTFEGTRQDAQKALEAAGYQHYAIGFHFGQTEYRLPAEGRNSVHFNIDKKDTDPRMTVPTTGNMHVGEYYVGTDPLGHLWQDVLHQ